MTSLFTPLKSIQSLVFAGILASAALTATAQTAAPTAPATAGAPVMAGGHHGKHMGRYDPAQRQARIAQHQAELKAQLKLTPAQEGAWNTYSASMQPPVRGARPERAAMKAELDKLSTPERIDKMRALRAQHMTEMSAAMDKRGNATKTFYAALTPEQQKVFDNQRRGGGKGRGGHHGQHHKG